ncbi:MAG: branched-chain amino acid ABC transporter permease [Thermincola sp.]|jgi:branched-chain amino acid transport system permease protein|nr:branched-chain amino acid ABC transporter permease [Thermincola sp.]MDT3704932.1 branched-chain amino acid ABC transporter permease [Thermincola sp.]
MGLLNQILQYFLSGLTAGGIYALIAVGFVVIYNVSGVVNFAQGEFVMLGAMITISLVNNNIPIIPAIILAILITMIIGMLLQWLAIRPVKSSSVVTLIIITMGASILMKGAALLIWGTTPYTLPAFTQGSPLTIGEATLNLQSLWVIGVTILVSALLFYFFEKTFLGKAVRACMINKIGARLEGISPQKMSLVCFGLSAGIGAAAGIVVAPITLATFDMGSMLGLKGFVAAVLAGLTSVPGAIAGGLVLGVMESLGAGLISSGFKDGIAFIILLLVLVLKPEGIFGPSETKRV